MRTPASGVIQSLRLTPRNHDGQYVVRWRIDVSADCPLAAHEDAFGNITHVFTADGPFDELVVHVEGEVDTQDTNGLVQRRDRAFSAISLFLRETALTAARSGDRRLRSATCSRASDGERLAADARAARALNREIVFDTDPTHAATTASEAFALKRGVCQDLTHIFIAAARSLAIPARYVGGYFHRADGVVEQEAGHAWAEAFVPDLGWVAFDPTNGICATDAHLRVAIGLDYLGAAPVRGTRFGGTGEDLDVRVRVAQVTRQTQN